MSSYRRFATDQDWNYLRNPVNDGLLHFKELQEGVSELLVDAQWPTLVKYIALLIPLR
jgi:hypothetical protein